MKLVKRTSAFPVFDSVLNDFFSRGFFDDDRLQNRLPAVNVQETEDGFGLEFAIPGLKKEDVKIELKERQLKVYSERSEEGESTNEQGRYTRREFGYQAFSRLFTLPRNVDTEAIEARFEDGVLFIKLPKKAELESANKMIEIA